MTISSLFEFNNWTSYKFAKPNVDLLYKNIIKLNEKDNIVDLKNFLFNQ